MRTPFPASFTMRSKEEPRSFSTGKSLSTRLMLERARALQQVCHRTRTPLIINDRVDVALAVQADGAFGARRHDSC